MLSPYTGRGFILAIADNENGVGETNNGYNPV
jgi:hypothetical protein